jgi:predicted secreted protein
MTTSEWCVVKAERGALGPCALADQDLAVPGEEIVRRLFGARVIDDGAGMIQLDVPHVTRRGDDVPLSVEVNWWLVLTKAVARLYLIADGNRNPLLSSVSLIPDLVPPHVRINVRLDGNTDVRAVVECGDGTLLQVRRSVRVMPHASNAGDVNGALGAQLDRRADRT